MPPSIPPKAIAAFRFLHYADHVERISVPQWSTRDLSKREAACRDAALDMLTLWFMDEIDIEAPMIYDFDEDEMRRKLDEEEDGGSLVPVGGE